MKTAGSGQGKRDFEDLADVLIAEWYEQIESQKGLTRRYARHQVELYLFARWQKPNECWSSNEWILKHGRAQADSLVRLGYTPKWLDSDFPLPVK